MEAEEADDQAITTSTLIDSIVTDGVIMEVKEAIIQISEEIAEIKLEPATIEQIALKPITFSATTKQLKPANLLTSQIKISNDLLGANMNVSTYFHGKLEPSPRINPCLMIRYYIQLQTYCNLYSIFI